MPGGSIRGAIRALGRRFVIRAGGPRSLKDVLFLRQGPPSASSGRSAM